MKDARSSECFAIATGVNAEEETNLGEYLSHYNGEELYEEVASNVTVTVLPGYIEDTSFIPPEAKERCSQFRWMAATNGEAGVFQLFVPLPFLHPCPCSDNMNACNGENSLILSFRQITCPMLPTFSILLRAEILGSNYF